MTKIRVVLLLVCVGLVAPVGLLVKRALDGVAVERVVRHQAIAERAFEEMERALSRFLQTEEARPFGHYSFYLPASAPDGGGATLVRSPLAALPDRGFVLGYFQIDPDGSLQTPLRPRDLELARTAGDWPPPAEVEQAIVATEQVVGGYWRTLRNGVTPPSPLATETQTPGSTVRIEGPASGKGELLAGSDAEAREQRQDRAYDVLQSFNRAVEERAARKQQVTEQPYSAVYGETEAEKSSVRPSHLPPGAASGKLRPPAPQESFDEAFLREGALEQDEPTVRIALDPMVGRSIDRERFLLYRTVLVGEQGYRQGMLLDRGELGRWLEREVITANALAEVASVVFFSPGDEAPALGAKGGFAFEHRFAEPFDGLAARLNLELLPGVGSPTAIYALAALVLLGGAAGVFAVYRMVSVVVHFAERRNNFVAAVSHELKTPLTAIRMYGEMLSDGLVESEAKRADYHRTITEESERLSRLINNVLEFSRLEKGQRRMNLVAGPIGPILEEALEKLRPHAKREGFTLRAEIAEDLPWVRFDRDAMLQVLFNLVDNSMKYARTARLREIVLGAGRQGERVVVSVRDFGPGVPRRHLTRVFEPFYRGEDELTRATKGTGIGLALVKDLADRMGAAVSGENAHEGGFCVQIGFRPAES